MKAKRYYIKNERGEEVLNLLVEYKEDEQIKPKIDTLKLYKNIIKTPNRSTICNTSRSKVNELKMNPNYLGNLYENKMLSGFLSSSDIKLFPKKKENIKEYLKERIISFNTNNSMSKTDSFKNVLNKTPISINKKKLLFPVKEPRLIKSKNQTIIPENFYNQTRKKIYKIKSASKNKQKKHLSLTAYKLNKKVYKIPLSSFRQINKIKETKSNNKIPLSLYQDKLFRIISKSLSHKFIDKLRNEFENINKESRKSQALKFKKDIMNLEQKEEKIMNEIRVNNENAKSIFRELGFTITKREFPKVTMKKIFINNSKDSFRDKKKKKIY